MYRSNPQLERLLRTEFRAMVVGHAIGGRMMRFLAPGPPRIHAFVYSCTGEEVLDFTSSLEFLPPPPLRTDRLA